MASIKNSKIISVMISLVIIMVLVFNGPASAFSAQIYVSNTSPTKGQKINFIIKVSSDVGEKVNYLKLVLSGPKNFECVFNYSGTILSGCRGAKIFVYDKSENNNGYGYGNEKKLEYNITFDTIYLDPGIYSSKIILIGVKTKEFPGDKIVVSQGNVLEKCSVRAKDGLINYTNGIFTKNDINFYIPLIGAKIGEGKLTGQNARNRFSYSFDVLRGIKNTPNEFVFEVSGNLKLDKIDMNNVKAVIYLDKLNNKIRVASDRFNVSNMDVTLRKFC